VELFDIIFKEKQVGPFVDGAEKPKGRVVQVVESRQNNMYIHVQYGALTMEKREDYT